MKQSKLEITTSYVEWHKDEKTKTDKFYRYTKFSDDSIMGEPITMQEYYNELEW